jgi:ketosteroid isomerase-like protein
MKLLKIFSFTGSIIFLLVMHPIKVLSQVTTPKYEMTVSKDFYDNMVYLDSLFFDAYNHCNIAVMDSLMSEDLEFFHDQGGFSNSKKQTMDAVRKNICGKVTRELLKGSIEVYQIKDYGAVQIGFHGFHNNQEKETGPMHFSKFVHIWRLQNNRWRITRVISLH